MRGGQEGDAHPCPDARLSPDGTQIYPCRVSHAIFTHQMIFAVLIYMPVVTPLKQVSSLWPDGWWLVPRLLFGVGTPPTFP